MSEPDGVIIEKTPKTPYVNFDASTGHLILKGKSIPENVISFYKPLSDWLEHYIQAPKEKTVFEIQLDYFNTSSAKVLLDLLKKTEQIQTQGKGEVVLNWLYDEDDEDMMEAGEDFKTSLRIKLNLISFKRED